MERIRWILFSVPDIEVPIHDEDNKENPTIVKEGKAINIPVIKNTLY